MTSQLNGYRNFIDIRNKEGQALVSNAVDKFISPLVGDERVQLLGKDFQKLKDNLLRLGSRYGFDYLIKQCATVRTVIPEIVEDLAAVPQIDGVPEEILYTKNINMLEHYSDENIVLARKHASLTWGDRSFTIMASNTIEPLTVANGGLIRAGTLSEEGKELVLERMHSKILGHQVMELLAPSARQAIEQHAHLFTWITQNGREEEVDGLTIVALILSRIRPNFKVDMYSEITKVKQLTITQYDNDVQLFFDAIKFLKLHIDQKDPTAYTEDAFIRDIFLQLKQESLPAEFRIEFGRQETRWMMNKAKITSASLMDDASAYFVNLKNTGNWKTEISRNTQIIALTTQITALETKVTKLSSAKAPTGHPATLGGATGTPGGAGTGGNYTFELWRLEKVDSKAEHSMIERDGKTWYWCDNHTYNNKGVVTQGMYVFHKPGAEHDAWRAKKDRFKKGGPKEYTVTTPKVPTPATGSSDPSAAKLSLSKSLQAALVTTAGLSADQFQKIWADACSESGN
jgi:hypothetical protein